MFEKFKLKIKHLLVSTIALILVLPFLLISMINEKTGRDEKDERWRSDDGYFHEARALKYGGPREPFLRQILKILKIFGAVRFKETGNPAKGIELRIAKPEIKTVPDKNGNYTFEIYNIVYNTFEIEVIDSKTGKALQNHVVKFDNMDDLRYENAKTFTGEVRLDISL